MKKLTLKSFSVNGLKTLKIKCPHCGHEWISRSKIQNITCPSCRGKINRKKANIERLDMRVQFANLPDCKRERLPRHPSGRRDCSGK